VELVAVLVQDLFRQSAFGNTIQDWLLAILVFLLTFVLLPLLRGVVRRQAGRYLADRPPTAVAFTLYLLEHTSRLVLLTVALYFAEKILTLPRKADRFADIVIVVSFWVQMGLWFMAAVRFGLQRWNAERPDQQLAGTINIMTFAASLIIWAVVALLALDNLGVNITALVAGLGVGGIAIALAVQTILGDLFASLSIALDKPFGVGDLLRIDDYEGVVEHIGVKSTRLRSVSGEQIIIANADMLKSRVRNFQRLYQRRAQFTLFLPHDCTAEQVGELPRLVAAAVEACPGARFIHCQLRLIGETALEFEIVFFVPIAQGNELSTALDVVNRVLLAKLRSAGITLAIPTHAVKLVQPADSINQPCVVPSPP
jgi:small-conductance mechanosensitive channel